MSTCVCTGGGQKPISVIFQSLPVSVSETGSILAQDTGLVNYSRLARKIFSENFLSLFPGQLDYNRATMPGFVCMNYGAQKQAFD